ncbi:MAG: hypothetical protein ONA90_11555 [candidate division KSB1 bacterium]|nr:hypothetical protein [candidate division KSB1 bacterium]
MQQKLLFVASAIIVGIGILTGLRTSQESFHQAQYDGIKQELMIIAGRAQAWYRTPAAVGGGGGSFAKLNWTALYFNPVTIYGTFELSDLRKESFRVTGRTQDEAPIAMTLQVFADSVSVVQISEHDPSSDILFR